MNVSIIIANVTVVNIDNKYSVSLSVFRGHCGFIISPTRCIIMNEVPIGTR